ANDLVVFPADGSARPRPIASGRDFYSSPRISPDGRRLAWTSWDHPLLPFEGADLCVADFAEEGALANERRVAGSEREAVTQPVWSPDGVLHFVNDPNGWWNLYAEERGVTMAATETAGSAVVTIAVESGEYEIVKRELEHEIEARYVSRPEPIAFPGDGGESYGFFYPPVNPEFAAPDGELPPLVVV